MPDATPIFTTRDPATGAVLFDFTGHIHAKGVDLDAIDLATHPFGTDLDNRVGWLNPLGALVAQMAGFTWLSGPATGSKTAAFGSANADGTFGTFVECDDGPTEADDKVAVGANTQTKTIIRGDGVSSFVQTGSALRDLRLNAGTVTVNIPNDTAGTASIAHGLGRTPIAWAAMAVGYNFMCCDQGRNSTNVTVSAQVVNPPGGVFNGGVTVNWIAVG